MLDKKLVRHVAQLAKLEFDDATLKKFTSQLDEIIQMENELTKLDTTGVAPTTHIARQETALRPDQPQPTQTREQLLQNVPKQQAGYVKVPSILDNGEDAQ